MGARIDLAYPADGIQVAKLNSHLAIHHHCCRGDTLRVIATAVVASIQSFPPPLWLKSSTAGCAGAPAVPDRTHYFKKD
jgi:hypothetical protein